MRPLWDDCYLPIGAPLTALSVRNLFGSIYVAEGKSASFALDETGGGRGEMGRQERSTAIGPVGQKAYPSPSSTLRIRTKAAAPFGENTLERTVEQVRGKDKAVSGRTNVDTNQTRGMSRGW